MNNVRLSSTPSCRKSNWKSKALLLLLASLGARFAAPARAADGPTIVKPYVYVGVEQIVHLWSPTAKKFVDNTTAWAPHVRFYVQGPINGGSQFSVEFTKPGGAAWWKMDCPTNEIKADDYADLATPRPEFKDDKKYTNGVGVYGFKIRLKNEVTGENRVMFTGRFKVGKIPKGMGQKGRQNIVAFYVDNDAMLPIGYIRHPDESSNHNPPFSLAMWFKGDINGSDLAGYLFYKGKQIASTKDQGTAGTEEEALTTNSNDAGDPRWGLWEITWTNILITNPRPEEELNPAIHYLDKNPGQYEVKVTRAGKLARSATFTVGEDGKIVDNGLVAANNLATYRTILPVKVLGTLDGTWQKMAWKTEAFYGNPMKGFTAP